MTNNTTDFDSSLYKRCSRCKEVKLHNQYSPDKRKKDGLYTTCKECRRDVCRQYREKYPDRIKNSRIKHSVHNPGKWKEYTRRFEEANPGRLRELSKRSKKKNSETIKQSNRLYLLRKYSLTPEEYQEMNDRQHGVCAICGRANKSGKPLYVDHNHVTGKVRGLLCAQCNSRLGVIENTLYVAKAKAYLDTYDKGGS